MLTPIGPIAARIIRRADGAGRPALSKIQADEMMARDGDGLFYRHGSEFERMRQDARDLCESPIEREMLEALWGMGWYFASWGEYQRPTISRAGKPLARAMEIPEGDSVTIRPQAKLKADRVDFVVVGFACGDIDPARLVIECDGHAFHEKTPGHAARDKARDRRISALGYTVLRFTGTEIRRRPEKCAAEVHKMVSARMCRSC